MHIRAALKRVRTPLILALSAIAILVILNSFRIDAQFVGPAEIAVRMLVVAAFGWVVLNLGNWFWDLRLRRQRIDVPDNLRARAVTTRLRVLKRMWAILVVTLTVGAALTAIPWARQIGVSIFASAGIAGIAIGIAAQPVLSNLIAGLQLAFTQPMRLQDQVVVEGESGFIEEIGTFHVVIRLWDLRRLIVPLKYFIDQPFRNLTYREAATIGAVFWYLDYTAPVAAMRAKLREIVEGSPMWDGQVLTLNVTDANDRAIEVRALASARNGGDAFNLRCMIREKMLEWLQAEAPDSLPRTREVQVEAAEGRGGAARSRELVGAAAARQSAQPDIDPTLDNPDQDAAQKGLTS